MDVNWPIINAHEQKYKYSCIPSAVEVILKLLNEVGVYYYDLQREWGDKKDGSFDCFNGYKYRGVTFAKEDRSAERIFQAIDNELRECRYVIISLGIHMWVIYDRVDHDYLSFSKWSKLRFGIVLEGNKSDLVDRLNNNSITEDLRWEFISNQIVLSCNANVLEKAVDREWLINDEDKDHLVRKEDNELKIYDFSKTIRFPSNLRNCVRQMGSTDILVYRTEIS